MTTEEVWTTNCCLTQGIVKVPVLRHLTTGNFKVMWTDREPLIVDRQDCHATWEEAREVALKQRTNAVLHAERRLDELRGLEFPIHPPAPPTDTKKPESTVKMVDSGKMG